MRIEKKPVKPGSAGHSKKTDKKPSAVFSKFFLISGLITALSFSPNAKADDVKWEECACGEPKMVQCGNSLYKGSKKEYDPEKEEYVCYCAACPDSENEGSGLDIGAYLNELAKKEVEGNKPEVKKEPYKELPSVDVSVQSDEKGFMEKWLELELKVVEKADETELLDNGFSTSDYQTIKSKSTKKLKKIESVILKKLKKKGVEKPKTEKEVRLFFDIITDAVKNDLGIKYEEGGFISKGLMENKLDCDLTSAITVQIADVLDLPIRVIVTVGKDSTGHAFLAWEFENGDYLYYESTSGNVMDYKELKKKHEKNKKKATSTCPDSNGDTICDSIDSSLYNMYNINPKKHPEVFSDVISRLNLISAMKVLKTGYDDALNDLDFYWDAPEYLAADMEYLSTMYIGGMFSSKALNILDPMIELVGTWDESAGIYKMRGDVHKSRGENDKAAEDYNTAKQKYKSLLDSGSKSLRLYVGYGETLMNLGEDSKAEKYLNKGIAICSKLHDDGTAIPSTYYWWGVALDAKGEYKEARDKYELGLDKCDKELVEPKYKYQRIDIYEVKYALYIRMEDEGEAQNVSEILKNM